ncbi:hypothetical protein EDB92DRAFT_1866870, partial [Lactarius akahatsu]
IADPWSNRRSGSHCCCQLVLAGLFQECDHQRIFHRLCNPTAMWENVFLLILTGVVKIAFTA